MVRAWTKTEVYIQELFRRYNAKTQKHESIGSMRQGSEAGGNVESRTRQIDSNNPLILGKFLHCPELYFLTYNTGQLWRLKEITHART